MTTYIPYRSPAIVLRNLSVQVPAELHDDIEREAAERHTSVSFIARERLSRKTA